MSKYKNIQVHSNYFSVYSFLLVIFVIIILIFICVFNKDDAFVKLSTEPITDLDKPIEYNLEAATLKDTDTIHQRKPEAINKTIVKTKIDNFRFILRYNAYNDLLTTLPDLIKINGFGDDPYKLAFPYYNAYVPFEETKLREVIKCLEKTDGNVIQEQYNKEYFRVIVPSDLLAKILKNYPSVVVDSKVEVSLIKNHNYLLIPFDKTFLDILKFITIIQITELHI